MAERQICCFKGRGEIHLVNYADRLARTAGFLPVGNASAFAINATEKTENIPDYTSPAGGTACAFRELDAITVTMALRCHNPRNWALATQGGGADATVEKTAIVDEPHTLWPGAVEPLEHLPDDSVAVIVKAADTPAVYQAGVDYEITPSGSIRHLDGGAIKEPDVQMGQGVPNIKVSYTRRDQTLIQLYATPPKEVALHFDGFNVAKAPVQPVQFSLFRVLFGPAAAVTVIGDNLASLELTGTVERDPTRALGTLADPFSQYGTLKV
ncbi:MAG: hypothetical protein FWG56_11475 [Desulfovibrionaceae bacterium]|jgi:hypothetical protein|nr:hypothetical protein [Desulfovibrionaceae bacterium]